MKSKNTHVMIVMEPRLHALSQVLAKHQDMSLSRLIRSLLRKELQLEGKNANLRRPH